MAAKTNKAALETSDLIIAGSKIYGTCIYCHSLVRLNKPIFGSLHICLTDAERAEVDRQRRSSV